VNSVSFKVKIKGLNKVEIQVKKRLEDLLKDTTMLNEVGETTAKMIVNNARSGSVFKNDKKEKIKKLKNISIAHRKYLAKYNSTSDVYSASRSNLSFTGQFLKSIKHTVKRGLIIIEPTGSRTGYKTGPKTKDSNPPSNKQLAKFLADNGREIFGGLDKIGIKRLKTLIIRFLRRKLRTK